MVRGHPSFDQDAFHAAIDLVGRSGAKHFEIGYIGEETDPADDVTWWAHAQYRGTRVGVEGKADPVEAVEALARRLLNGARCRRCGEPIVLSDDATGCRWKRDARKWIPGCGYPIDMTIPAAP